MGEVLHSSLLQLLLEHCDFLNIDISQGSVATRLRCGGIFKYELVANVPVSQHEVISILCIHTHEQVFKSFESIDKFLATVWGRFPPVFSLLATSLTMTSIFLTTMSNL